MSNKWTALSNYLTCILLRLCILCLLGIEEKTIFERRTLKFVIFAIY